MNKEWVNSTPRVAEMSIWWCRFSCRPRATRVTSASEISKHLLGIIQDFVHWREQKDERALVPAHKRLMSWWRRVKTHNHNVCMAEGDWKQTTHKNWDEGKAPFTYRGESVKKVSWKSTSEMSHKEWVSCWQGILKADDLSEKLEVCSYVYAPRAEFRTQVFLAWTRAHQRHLILSTAFGLTPLAFLTCSTGLALQTFVFRES